MPVTPAMEFELPGTGAVADVVRQMLAERSIDRAVSAETNLSELGLKSFDMVELVLTLESTLNVTIPESHITPAHFRSIASIGSLVSSLQN